MNVRITRAAASGLLHDLVASFKRTLAHERSPDSVTLYLRQPEIGASRKRGQHATAQQELASAVFRYRVQILPFLGTAWLVAISLLTGDNPVWHAAVTCVYLGAGAWLVKFGYRFKLYRPVERWYAGSCAVAAGVWNLGTGKPGVHDALVALLGTAVCAAPFWYHRRARGSIPVRMDGLDRAERTLRISQVRKLVTEWTAFTSAGHLHGAKLQAVTYNRWSVVLAVVMRRGSTVEEFTVRRLGKLESAFGDVKAGAARVERVDRHARLATVRFMMADPHEYPIKPPETGQSEIERVTLGLFETGEEVLFLLVNTLIGGMTGSGKSGVVNVIIRALARMPQVAVLGIDMKPGAPELGKWRKVMHALATDAEGACDLLDKLREGLEYRGSVMSELGIRTWRPTRDQPFIVLIVDELQELKAARLGTKFDRIVAIIRAYGGCVIGATQYPTRNNVSPTVKENCPQKIGLLTEGATADRVIFGESATKDRWSPSSIPPDRQGSFFVRSPEYKRPMLARAYFVDDDAVDHDAELLAPMRTLIDVGTWPAIDRPHRPRDEIGAGGGQRADDAETETEADGDDGGVCDAILIDDDPLELVLQMLGKPTGDGKDGWRPVDIGAALDLSRATVYRRLAQLAEKGLASSIEKGRWVKT